jgi:hypothetical protein
MLMKFAGKKAKSNFSFGKNENGKGKHTRTVERLSSSLEKKNKEKEIKIKEMKNKKNKINKEKPNKKT